MIEQTRYPQTTPQFPGYGREDFRQSSDGRPQLVFTNPYAQPGQLPSDANWIGATMPVSYTPDDSPQPQPEKKRQLSPEQILKINQNMASFDQAYNDLTKIIKEQWPGELQGMVDVIEKINKAHEGNSKEFMEKVKGIMTDYEKQLKTNTYLGAAVVAVLLTAATLGTMSWASGALAAGTMSYAQYFALVNVLVPVGVGAANTYFFRPPSEQKGDAYMHDILFSLGAHGAMKGLFKLGQSGFAYMGMAREAPIAFKGVGEFAWKNNQLVFKPQTWRGATMNFALKYGVEPAVTGAAMLTLFTISDHTFLKHNKPLTAAELKDAALTGLFFGVGLNAYGKIQLKATGYLPKNKCADFGEFAKEYNQKMRGMLEEMKIDTSKMDDLQVAQRGLEEFNALSSKKPGELLPEQQALKDKFSNVIAGFQYAMDISNPLNKSQFDAMCKEMNIDPTRIESVKYRELLAAMDQKFNDITAKYKQNPDTKLTPEQEKAMRAEQDQLADFTRMFISEQVKRGNYEIHVAGKEFRIGDAPEKNTGISINPDNLDFTTPPTPKKP